MKIIILIGLPASGKSTWRDNYISENPQTEVISQDDLMYKIAYERNMSYSKVLNDKDIMKEINKIIISKLEYAVKNELDIIVDKTNTNIKARRKMTASLPKTYRKVFIWFDLDRCVVNYNNFKRYIQTGKYISDKTIDFMEMIFQEPEPHEYDELVIIKE